MLADVDAEARTRLQRLPDRDRLALSLRHDRFRGAVVDDVAGRALCLLAGEDAVDRCRGLQPRCRVHDVAGDEALAAVGTGVERHERLTGVDGDPDLDAVLLDRPVPDCERRPKCSLGVVLASDRRAEDRDDGVADELLDRAAPLFELRAQSLVVGAENRVDVLGVELLGARGEADQIGEEDRDDFAFAARLGHLPSLGRSG